MQTDGNVIIGTQLDTSEFEEDLDDLEEIAEVKGRGTGSVFSRAFSKMTIGIKRTLNGIFSKVSGIAKGLLRTISAITTMAVSLGVGLGGIGILLGVLGAGALILTNAFKKVFEENEQVKANIQYIIWAVGQALQPAVDYVSNILVNIVNLVIKAIQFVAVLIKMLTGKNIFANASAEKFKESMEGAEKGSKGTAKNLKEAKKQLTKFDEMEVLQDTSSSGGGTGAGTSAGFTMPDFNLADITNMEQAVENFKNKWKTFGQEMETSIKQMPFEVWTKSFGNWDLAMFGVTETAYGLWKMIEGLGKFVIGIVHIITGLITGDTELIKQGIGELISGIIMNIEGIYYVVKGIGDTIVGVIKGIVATIGEIISVFINLAISKFNNLKYQVEYAWLYIRDKIKGFIIDIQNWLTEKFGTIGTKIGNVIGGAISGVINAILGFAEGRINGFLRSINSAISVVNKIPGVSISKLSMVSFPRLAKGGILNRPGRGVPVGGAIAGEAGREFYMPLQDEQMLSLVGQAIGKYITINASITNTMNGRVISRELQRINNESDFAYNR